MKYGHFFSIYRQVRQMAGRKLQAACGETAVIEHEPCMTGISRGCDGKRRPRADGQFGGDFAHCEKIEEILHEKSYIECGWPAWGVIPYLFETLEAGSGSCILSASDFKSPVLGYRTAHFVHTYFPVSGVSQKKFWCPLLMMEHASSLPRKLGQHEPV